MPTATTRLSSRPLYVAFELGQRQWKLSVATESTSTPRQRTIAAGDCAALGRELAETRRVWGLAPTGPVCSCYEAGREGFWLHRVLTQQGIANVVVDSASIEVNRRKRRAKSDRLDGQALLRMLLRYTRGEARVWSVVHVPTPADEDRRHLHRALMRTRRDRVRARNRIRSLLASQGVALATLRALPARLPELRAGTGEALRPGLVRGLECEWAKLVFLTAEIRALVAERLAWLQQAPGDPVARQVRALWALRGVGIENAWVLVMEFFGWRRFRNRRELGALVGLVPTPYQSGESAHELGITKAGNRYVRALLIELAWSWVRRQPASALAQWYQARFATGGSRLRRIGIVAVARKLLIALWRYLETGVVPAGALLKA